MSTPVRTSAPAEFYNPGADSPTWRAHAEGVPGLPVLVLVATVLAGRSVLALAQDTDIYLAGLGILLTAVYITGLIFRPRRQVLGMGVDSLAVLVLYVVGTAGLVLVAGRT